MTLVLDLSSYSEALRFAVSVAVTWPTYEEVSVACDGAIIGRYHSFKWLCTYYHRLPLAATPKQRLIAERVRETYKRTYKHYQTRGKYRDSHRKTGTHLRWPTR